MRLFSATKEYENYRIDQFLANKLPSISRSLIQKLIKTGKVLINGSVCNKPSKKLSFGSEIQVEIPKAEKIPLQAENIPLDIVYEDSSLIVINKPTGMVVHPAFGNRSGTLVNALLFHCKDLSGIGGEERPGIVHRLDKETSGLIVVAKNDRAHNFLAKQFKDRKIHKKYLALVHGKVKSDSGTIDMPIGRSVSDRKKMSVVQNDPSFIQTHNFRKPRRSKARQAITHYRVIERFKDKTLLELKPETGRTHQIRVHLAHIGHPIVGDKIYGFKKDKSSSMALHSYVLGFFHPETNEYMEFKREKVFA